MPADSLSDLFDKLEESFRTAADGVPNVWDASSRLLDTVDSISREM